MALPDTVTLLICGGRTFDDPELMADVLAPYYARHRAGEIRLVIRSGCASGADHFAGMAAGLWALELQKYFAEWSRYGKQTGPRRNAAMIADGHVSEVIAFPGGRGTADMVARAKRAGIPVQEIAPR